MGLLFLVSGEQFVRSTKRKRLEVWDILKNVEGEKEEKQLQLDFDLYSDMNESAESAVSVSRRTSGRRTLTTCVPTSWPCSRAAKTPSSAAWWASTRWRPSAGRCCGPTSEPWWLSGRPAADTPTRKRVRRSLWLPYDDGKLSLIESLDSMSETQKYNWKIQNLVRQSQCFQRKSKMQLLRWNFKSSHVTFDLWSCRE